jgi:hypothetical protein
MLRSISALPPWLTGAVMILVLPAIVVLVQWGIRRRWPALTRGEQNDVVGFVIAVVGVIYAVLLAFVVIVAWENFDEAEQIVGQEASTLRGIYRDSLALPPEAQDDVQDLVLQYAREVTTREWPSMAEAEPGDPRTGLIFDDLTRVLSSVEVETPAQQEFVGAAAERLSELVSLRSQRLDFVEIGIPGVLWLALIIGGVVTIGFALLFGLENAVLQFVMVGSLAVLVGVLLFVALMVNYPFTGDVAVQPDSFLRVLDDFGEPLPSAAVDD